MLLSFTFSLRDAFSCRSKRLIFGNVEDSLEIFCGKCLRFV